MLLIENAEREKALLKQGYRNSRTGPLLDLQANNPGVSTNIEVLVLNISQSVWKVHHVPIRKLDVKLLIVEIDVHLRKEKREKREFVGKSNVSKEETIKLVTVHREDVLESIGLCILIVKYLYKWIIELFFFSGRTLSTNCPFREDFFLLHCGTLSAFLTRSVLRSNKSKNKCTTAHSTKSKKHPG